jgi:hypothetical protein
VGNAWVIGAYTVCLGDPSDNVAPEIVTAPLVTLISYIPTSTRVCESNCKFASCGINGHVTYLARLQPKRH